MLRKAISVEKRLPTKPGVWHLLRISPCRREGASDLSKDEQLKTGRAEFAAKRSDGIDMPHALPQSGLATLRRKALKVIRKHGKDIALPPALDSASLVEEIRIQQAELEIQNQELQESRAQTEEAQRRYFRHFDLAPVAMIRLDHKGLILEANILGAAMLGFARIRLHTGKAVFATFLTRDSKGIFYAHLQTALASSKMESCELSLRSRLGVETLVRMQSIANHGVGNSTDLLVTLTDLTEHEQIQKKLAQQTERAVSATLAKDNFLAMLSHELRTPLTPVSLIIEELEHSTTLSEQDRAALAVLRRNLGLEAHLIDELLDLTRISKGRLQLNRELTDARICLGDAVEICRHAIESKPLELNIKFNAPHYVVDADSARLQQIIWNLLQNAIKFTSVGGAVSVRLFNSSPGRLAFEVADTGIGLEPESMQRIFDPFVQATQTGKGSFSGLGLGLAISRSLAQAHDGSLTAFSAGPGKGSTFRLELPALEVNKLPGTPPPRATSVLKGQANLRLLLVEDHDDTRDTLRRLLIRRGYAVEAAADAAAARAFCARQEFDLLISDISLPDDSGLELMKEMKERHKLSGVAMSGFGMDSDITLSKEAGFSEHLTKPIDLQELHAAIQRVAVGNKHSG